MRGLECMFGDVFGVELSQGALNNMLKRSHAPFAAGKSRIIEDLRRGDVVASDETGIRIEGVNGYHWVFLSERAVVHEPRLSRAAQVVRDVMAGHKPTLWLSDGYSAQQNHGAYHQTCLAHLARDVAYAAQASDDDVPFRLKLWLDRVFCTGARHQHLCGQHIESKEAAVGKHPCRHLGCQARM